MIIKFNRVLYGGRPMAGIGTRIEKPASLIVADRHGEMHVFLDPGGDHIVIKFIVNGRGERHEVMLARDSWAWDRAVARAARGQVFP